MFGLLHKWTIEEDIIVATHALNRKTDLKTIRHLSARMGIAEGKIQYRMSNYSNMAKGIPDRHYSKQERRVFDFLTKQHLISVKPNK